MKTVLLYGASGFVGRHIHNDLLLYCNVIGVAFKHPQKDLAYSDCTKYEMVKEDILGCQPDYVVFAAGNKNRNIPYKELYRDNVTPIKNIYKVIHKYKLKTKVIFISTDSVFLGAHGGHHAGMSPLPQTNYGKTKYLAERSLDKFFPNKEGYSNPVDYRIIRTSAVIGKGSLFLSWLQDNLSKGNKFKVYADQYLSPTSIELLTNSIIYIIKNWSKVEDPIIHICGRRMSRYRFACMVKEAMKSNTIVSKDYGELCDTSMIPSDIQKKIIHKPMKEFLCSII